MTWLFRTQWGTLTTSTSVAVLTGVAIFGFGVPPVVLVPVTWVSVAIYTAVGSRFERRLGRR